MTAVSDTLPGVKTLLAALIATLTLATGAAARPIPHTIHLYGDSIMKGYGFGQYDHPSFLNRIDLIASRLAAANGATHLRFRRTSQQEPQVICAEVRSGRVKPRDVIVFEDAGPRAELGATYRGWLEQVAACAKGRGRPPSRLTFTTMFDYPPLLPLAGYDDPLPDGGTINMVTRRVAAAAGARLMDWNALMDRARAALGPLGVHVMPPGEGIHPGPLGNVVLAASLVRQQGVVVRNVGVLVDELLRERAKLEAMRVLPMGFTRADADGWARRLVIR